MIKGIHSVGISVVDIEQAIEFYTQATGFDVVKRYKVAHNPALDKVFGIDNIAYETAVFHAKTAFVELTQFHTPPTELGEHEMPVPGPGMTHVCYQSPVSDPAYTRFKTIGARMISRGDEPIDLMGAGITYAYARDPERNIFEVEQLDQPPQPYPIWLGHVAMATHDIERLSRFYGMLLGIEEPASIVRVADNPRLDEVADIDNLELLAAWIRELNMTLEFWQFVNPATPPSTTKRTMFTPGYNKVCFEVDDIEVDYQRLQQLGIAFLSAPIQVDDSMVAYGYDPDGNLFQLQQFLNEQPDLS
jgi:catechol 2,3-dioxygenase-like lactoylglutathione lyase family enzyme